jgi:DNA helicase-2/ATP-dependent DNA helicase PcrA
MSQEIATVDMPPFNATPEQQAILGHDLRRHARILAGPGTGKSATVIALLNIRLPREPNFKVKLLTFTRAATQELSLKFFDVENPVSEPPNTIHSFCISVLLSNPGLGEFPKPLRIADDWETSEIIRPDLAGRLSMKQAVVKELFAELAANWESLNPSETQSINASVRARFTGGWIEHREIYGYTLLAELPYALRTALRDHPDLEGVDYDVLVVDEYQDLNACDLEILQRMAERRCAIFAAGDDDQSIYSFRKAHPEGIRRFLDNYSDAADYTLSITQRCGKRIVAWANYVIQGDISRPADRQSLRAADTAPDGDVALLAFKSDVAEAKGIAELVKHLIFEKHVEPSQVLILTRTDHNGQFSRRIKEELRQRGIGFSGPGTIDDLFSREDNRRALSMLRIGSDEEDSLAWASLLVLTPNIGQAFFDYIYGSAQKLRATFAEALLSAHREGFPGAPTASSRIAATLIANVLAWAATFTIPEQTPEDGWGAWIAERLSDSGTVELSPEFRDLLLAVDNRIDATTDFGRYLGQIWPLAKDIACANSADVRIMTLGGSKGLTVEVAILAGLEAGIIPRDSSDLAEERRLLYVGMTRAKRFLYGTWARRRRGPTARTGRPHVNRLRQLSPFLEGGPVQSRDGDTFINSF